MAVSALFIGEVRHGAQIHVTDRDTYQALRTATSIIDVIRRRWPAEFSWKRPPYEYEEEKLPIEILTGGPVEKTFPRS